MGKVSVIVPIYNVSKYIERCVRSLFEQALREVEFIFVDDASPDDSVDILNKVLNEYPQRKSQVKILHNEQNKGLAATRFVGMNVATGDYVIHCDSDDWIEPDMLQSMYEKALKDNADIVCCEAVRECKDGSSPYHYTYDKETIENGLLTLNFSEIHVAIWNKLVRRSLFSKYAIKNYDGINMSEDSALTVRLRYYSKCTSIIHKPFYHYNRLNESSMVANIKEDSIKQQILLASHLEKFFRDKHELPKFIHVVNYYKFISKQHYLRDKKNIKKWKQIYPECHKDIFKFKQLTVIGRIKWYLCAYLPLWLLKIKFNK